MQNPLLCAMVSAALVVVVLVMMERPGTAMAVCGACRRHVARRSLRKLWFRRVVEFVSATGRHRKIVFLYLVVCGPAVLCGAVLFPVVYGGSRLHNKRPHDAFHSIWWSQVHRRWEPTCASDRRKILRRAEHRRRMRLQGQEGSERRRDDYLPRRCLTQFITHIGNVVGEIDSGFVTAAGRWLLKGCFLWCVCTRSSTAVGVVLLLCTSQHSRIRGACRILSSILVGVAVHETKAALWLPIWMALGILCPVFPAGAPLNLAGAGTPSNGHAVKHALRQDGVEIGKAALDAMPDKWVMPELPPEPPSERRRLSSSMRVKPKKRFALNYGTSCGCEEGVPTHRGSDMENSFGSAECCRLSLQPDAAKTGTWRDAVAHTGEASADEGMNGPEESDAESIGDACSNDADCAKREEKGDTQKKGSIATDVIARVGTDGLTTDPRRIYELAIDALAKNLIEKPTLPDACVLGVSQAELEDEAIPVATKHCPFKLCDWTGDNDEDLCSHWQAKHSQDGSSLEAAVRACPENFNVREKTFASMAAAIATRVRQGAPLACSTIDRRALENYVDQFEDEKICALICCSCACIYPYAQGQRRHKIEYRRAVSTEGGDDIIRYLGLSKTRCEQVFGKTVYMQRYGDLEGGPALSSGDYAAELAAWTLEVPFRSGSVDVLCCAEDRKCEQCDADARKLCKECLVPVCHECARALDDTHGSKMPEGALSNDMWTGFASKYIYETKVTVMELICASACLVSLFCFSMEVEHGHLLNEKAHMQRHRVGARGNVTCFPLPLQELFTELQRQKELQEDRVAPMVPRTGRQLKDIVKILLKGSAAGLEKNIAQAHVRRDVVVQLILEAKRRGHRAYAFVDEASVRARAEELPENGVPPEVIHLFKADDALDKLQPQKAATPVAGRTAAEDTFDHIRPNAVVDEKSCADGADLNAQRTSAVNAVVERLRQEPNANGDENVELVVKTGNQMIDQFEPWFFGVAFPFIFKSCIAMPDIEGKARYRRKGDAPRLEIKRWAEIIARRCEAQYKRDWVLSYSLWNYIFRTSVNLSRTIYSYGGTKTTGVPARVKCKDLEEAAISICKALKGKYRSPDGVTRPVNGDITKVQYALNLHPSARTLLSNINHICAKIPGTQEIRRKMRHMTHAYRVAYGQSVFITMSPDEKHNLLMVRLSRLRRDDPIHHIDPEVRRWCGRNDPSFAEVEYVNLSADDINKAVPSYDQRRAMLARDPLACSDGFRITCELVLEYIFGVRFCPFCPDCNSANSEYPCQDIHGSSATPEGGIFGRADAFIGSIECQKAGSLHMHGQLFIQCLHQHTPLREIFGKSGLQIKKFTDDYLKYQAHVMRQVYDDIEGWEADRRKSREEAWPEYKDTQAMFGVAKYLKDSARSKTRNASGSRKEKLTSGKQWLKQFRPHRQLLQEHRQHHIHLPDKKNPLKRIPLTSCRRRDNPKLCKGDFPHDKRIIGEAVVLCPGLAKKLDMPHRGRKNRIGICHGPQNDAYLNATHGALLVAGGFNSDVKLPYRLPVIAETHSALCPAGEACYTEVDEDAMIEAAQRSQDAQVGYSCDYQNKRNPIALHEVREFIKGHATLAEDLQGEARSYIGKRHVQRIISDCYAKGIVRGAVESINLLTQGRSNDVTAAETMKTAQTEYFDGAVLISYVERKTGEASRRLRQRELPQVDFRERRNRRFIFKHSDLLYAHRGSDRRVHPLSAYEFAMYWEVVLAEYPQTLEEAGDGHKHHARMTEAGMEKLKLRRKGGEVSFVAGRDYVIKDGGDDWIAYPSGPETEGMRHDFIMRRRRRPVIPVFAGSPMPKSRRGSEERNSKITMAYFRPWCGNEAEATAGVVYVGSLRGDATTWTEELTRWAKAGTTCVETARYVNNFLCMSRVRPSHGEDEAKGVSEDFVSDEELILQADDLEMVVETRVGGRHNSESEDNPDQSDEDCGHHANSTKAIEQVRRVWGADVRNMDVKQRMPRAASDDVAGALAAARESQSKDPHTTGQRKREEKAASIEIRRGPSADKVKAWMDKVRQELNSAQMAVVELVVQRVMEEERVQTQEERMDSRPLLHLMHGGPGVGKSYVIAKVKEFYEEVMGWSIGDEYNIAALQAVMAVNLGGETLHHVAGINPFTAADSMDKSVATAEQIAQKFLRTRWLIIDEISMVSAGLLAQVDTKLRDIMREGGTYKCDLLGRVRSFGGLNVLFVGDFYQLDPPEGVSLASVPRSLLTGSVDKVPHSSAPHGQDLFWGRCDLSLSGITELTEPVRCKDPWYNQFLEECRHKELSEINYNFLSGKPTSVPGSWLNGSTTCSNAKCRTLVEKWRAEVISGRTLRECNEDECKVCRKMRQDRKRTVSELEEAMLLEAKFLEAPLIVPNNDVKYDANKRRAINFARRTRRSVYWCAAKDQVTADALAEDPTLNEKKKDWLQRHDRESGNLYGMLPLVEQMPVVLTDHVDRNPEKNLLRGRWGRIHSWVFHENESVMDGRGDVVLHKIPQVVYVQFYEDVDGKRKCKWRVHDLPAGVYPIRPSKGRWALDQRRSCPRLKIVRTQIPLAPAFAMTAHAAQGQTLKAAIVDLRISKESSPITSYVALSRVRRKEDILVFRHFPWDVFTKRSLLGPDLFLRHVGRQEVNWAELQRELDAASGRKSKQAASARKRPLRPTCSKGKLTTSPDSRNENIGYGSGEQGRKVAQTKKRAREDSQEEAAVAISAMEEARQKTGLEHGSCSGCGKRKEVQIITLGAEEDAKKYCSTCLQKVCKKCKQNATQKRFSGQGLRKKDPYCCDCAKEVESLPTCEGCGRRSSIDRVDAAATEIKTRLCRLCSKKQCSECGAKPQVVPFSQGQLRHKESLCKRCEKKSKSTMLTCRQCSESEPTVSFRYFKASPPGATRIYCDKHMKRAPNGWHQCAGCVFKGRVPFHPAQDFDEAAESYKKQCTSRKRCKVCVAEKTEEELEQARKRMKHVQKKEDDA